MDLMTICRYVFGAAAAIVGCLTLLSLIQYSYERNDLIWAICAVVGCCCGVVGAWKEHFLMSAICGAAWAGLWALTHFKGWYGGFYYRNHAIEVEIGMTIAGCVYAAVLYSNGKRDMGLPTF
ncbi:hypothetical protein DERP_012716 [Dermatophagoides pteronyssinus]|uniref:Uncharacterized protein n=1 Tax=Dermatophagoides pteronyssinus TaxID=6956 RepID=A0ABQ8JQ48_DERPT|nr:hypothetical protein DERP_012716 [Dermatophagoides pteronyssinus]